jgi:hypothetical protein
VRNENGQLVDVQLLTTSSVRKWLTLAVKQAKTTFLSVGPNLVQSNVSTNKMRKTFLPYNTVLIKYIFFFSFFFLPCFSGPFPGHAQPPTWRAWILYQSLLPWGQGSSGTSNEACLAWMTLLLVTPLPA